MAKSNMYQILNTGYPGVLGTLSDWDVTEDSHPSMLLSGGLKAALQPGTPFKFAIEDAIQACDRHVFVTGRPPQPLLFVQDFVNILRWEVSQLWEFKGSNLQWSSSRRLSHEHYSRSGELLAEGIATNFLVSRLGIPRQRFHFLSRTGSRPDYLASLKPRFRRAMYLGQRQFAIEVRMRKDQRNLYKEDRDELDSKKKGFSGALAVYVMWGDGKHRDGTRKTRIHVADPEDVGVEVLNNDIQSAAIQYYLTLASQIGLWGYRDHLEHALSEIKLGRVLESKMSSRLLDQDRSLTLPFELGERKFRGREFSSLVFEAGFQAQAVSIAERDAIRRQVWLKFDTGDFGYVYKKGLSEEVLGLIAESNWSGLADYKIETQVFDDGASRDDGTYYQSNIVLPGSNDALAIESQLPNRP